MSPNPQDTPEQPVLRPLHTILSDHQECRAELNALWGQVGEQLGLDDQDLIDADPSLSAVLDRHWQGEPLDPAEQQTALTHLRELIGNAKADLLWDAITTRTALIARLDVLEAEGIKPAREQLQEASDQLARSIDWEKLLAFYIRNYREADTSNPDDEATQIYRHLAGTIF